jgi:biotin-dependent carboxylase-like uncharacterized protein
MTGRKDQRALHVVDPGPFATVQDAGRPGLAHLGVPRSGWLDPGAARLANRLVGNAEDAALLECLLGGLVVRATTATTIAVTGAECHLRVDRRPVHHGAAVPVPAGATLTLGSSTRGLRCYVAVAGGLAVDPVLGSRATDTLSGLGPPVVAAGTVLPVGGVSGHPSDGQAVPQPVVAETLLRCTPGPRTDWFTEDALRALTTSAYRVAPDSDRVGLRLSGAALSRARTGELPSEGLVLGAVQVPADGRPLVFLNDHPTTGGYPVVGVVEPDDVGRCAQLRPGDTVRFRWA